MVQNSFMPISYSVFETMKILISFVFFFLCLSQHSVFADDKLIRSTCKRTPYYDLCVSTLKSDSRSGSSDVPKLALIIVDTISAKATYALNHVNDLLKSAKSPQVKKSLIKCGTNYYAVVHGDIPQAVAGLTQGDYKFAEEATNDAAIEAETCEKDFLRSPITDMNKNLHDLSVVAASIVHILMSRK